jgi:hypothetical protein
MIKKNLLIITTLLLALREIISKNNKNTARVKKNNLLIKLEENKEKLRFIALGTTFIFIGGSVYYLFFQPRLQLRSDVKLASDDDSNVQINICSTTFPLIALKIDDKRETIEIRYHGDGFYINKKTIKTIFSGIRDPKVKHLFAKLVTEYINRDNKIKDNLVDIFENEEQINLPQVPNIPNFKSNKTEKTPLKLDSEIRNLLKEINFNQYSMVITKKNNNHNN